MKDKLTGMATQSYAIQTVHQLHFISIKLFTYYKIWKEKYILVNVQ